MPKQKPIRVAVVFGGTSNERDISLLTGERVLEYLPAPYIPKAYDTGKDLLKLIQDIQAKKIDVVFNALHGVSGEDGSIQGLFELLKVPYTGSGILGSALAMDKAMAKRIFLATEIPTAPGLLITKRAWKQNKTVILKSMKTQLGKQIVIKPTHSGSSVGISVKPAANQWSQAVQKALAQDESSCLAESYIEGRELTVGVLGSFDLEVLPVIEIKTKRAFFDKKAKYTPHQAEEICPARIPDSIAQEAQALAMACHISLRCRSYSRTDLIWSRKQGLMVLETNTLPGLTEHSLLPKSAAVAGIFYPALLDRLLRDALRREV